MRSIKIKTEWFIIAVLVAILVFEGCSKEDPCSLGETEIKETIITEVDSVEVELNDPGYVDIIPEDNSFKVISSSNKLSEIEKLQVKKAYRYQDTSYVKDALIYSDILSEGKILKFSLNTSIDHLRTEITKTKIKQAGGLYISPGINFSSTGIKNVDLGIIYIKGKYGFGAGLYYDLATMQPGYSIKIIKKLL